MTRKSVFLLRAVLVAIFWVFPAWAAIPYFGYVGATNVDEMEKTKNYVNFVHVDAEYPEDPVLLAEINNANQRGLKVTIDLGRIFWCGEDLNYLCTAPGNTWQERWNRFKTYMNNAGVLTPSKVIAVTVRDEPLHLGASVADMQTAAAYIKSDPALTSWIKIWWVEAACKVTSDACGTAQDYNNAFNNAPSSVPSIDWIGINWYSVHPATDYEYQTARSRMKAKYPGKQFMYILDGWWEEGHANAFYPQGPEYMATIAREWYDMARADPAAALLGVFAWNYNVDWGTDHLPCNVVQEHTSIGRAITGKTRGQAPIGSWSIDPVGVLTGWTCDPDQAYCEANPRVDVRVNGTLVASFNPPNDGTFTNYQCGTGTAFKFKVTLPRNSHTKTVSVLSDDTDTAGATVASTCPQSPNCSWTQHIKYYGYSGTADETSNRGLDETKAFTNFSHVVQEADPLNTFVRDRVTQINARGLKATIDLGKLFWCGTNYRTLCTDWQTRWNNWKTTNATILTSDKVLVLVPRAQPFNYNVNMAQYDQLTAFLKADPTVGSWIKIWLVEAACVVASNNCGAYPGSNAWNNYTGTLPNVDWIGVDWYAMYPANDPTYQSAIAKVKQRYPSKPRVYIMDGYWDSAHATAFGSINNMKNVTRAWYDIAHNDPGAILIGIYAWLPFGSGITGSRDFPCYVLSEQRDIGREILGRTRPNTGQPVGRLDNIYDGSGLAFGYACDPDGSLCENPVIDFKEGAQTYSTTTNYPYRSYYLPNAACATGLMYRFEQTISSSASGRNITAFARDLDSGGTTLPSLCAENPACLWFRSSYQSLGWMDGVSPAGVAWGWVCDPDAGHLSSQVRLTANGTPIGTYTTNLTNEQAVADECQGGYLHRFSVQLPAWARYQTLNAYALDFTNGEALIPWFCPEGQWECTWY
jgi:hypothetical protein